MKNRTAALLLIFWLLGSAAWAGSSPSYRITAEILDAGGQGGNSSAYRLGGKARGAQAGTPGSAGYLIGEGFMRSAYFGAGVIFAPIVTGIEPNTGKTDELVEITNLKGANFLPGATVKFSMAGQSDISARDVVVASDKKITCRLDLAGAVAGLWNVTVTNPDGRSGTLPAGFRVNFPAPQVIRITPDKGVNNTTADISDLSGKYFRSGLKVWLAKAGESDLIASNVTVVSAQKITCRFDLNGRSTGLWSVVVENDDQQSATLRDAFKIEAAEPVIVGPVRSERNDETGVTTVKYVLSKDTEIIINVYNIRGERIWQQTLPAGSTGGTVGDNEYIWVGVTAFKEVASSGVYIIHIMARSEGAVRKIGEAKIMIMK